MVALNFRLVYKQLQVITIFFYPSDEVLSNSDNYNMKTVYKAQRNEIYFIIIDVCQIGLNYLHFVPWQRIMPT
jgi:hypothetical protein